jgi:hypothetical protein
MLFLERARHVAGIVGLALLRVGTRVVAWSGRLPIDEYPSSERGSDRGPDLSQDGFEMIVSRRPPSVRTLEEQTPISPLRGSPASRRRRA